MLAPALETLSLLARLLARVLTAPGGEEAEKPLSRPNCSMASCISIASSAVRLDSLDELARISQATALVLVLVLAAALDAS